MIVMLKLSAEVPPAVVAEQVTAVVPSGKVDPEAGLQRIVAESVAVTVNETALPAPLVASAVMSSGTVMMGAVAPPVTLTLNEPCVLFACESVAVH